MQDIIIVGASGFGKEIYNIITKINALESSWNILGFVDDAVSKGTVVTHGLRCLGNVDYLVEEITRRTSIVFGIENRNSVFKIIGRLESNINIKYPNIIHPSVEIGNGCRLGQGNVIAIFSTLSCDVTMGSFNFLNSYTCLGHDAKIKDFNSLMPRVQISGGVEVGSFNFFGMNSAVLQNKTIGNCNIINSYTFLAKSIKDDRKYFGVPARKINL